METVWVPHARSPEASLVRRALASGGRLGFDVETDGASEPGQARLVCWQVAEGRRAYVCSASGWPLRAPEVAEWLGDPRRQKATHHGAFESAVAWRQGLVLRGVVDTHVLAGVLVAGATRAQLQAAGVGGLSLKALVRRVFGEDLDKSLQRSFRPGAALSDEQVAYAAADAHWALRLAEALEAQVAKAGLEGLACLEQRAAVVAQRMGRVGVPIDPVAWWEACEAAQAAARDAKRRLAEALGAPFDLFGEPSLDPERAQRVGDALAACGAHLRRGPKGAWELSEEALRGLESHPGVALLLRYRREKKVADWLGAPVDGRLRPTWRALGAATGRMASKAPNVQALPGRLGACVAAGPGRVLVAADYSRQELYVLAALSGDEDLASALRSGDPYQAVADRSCTTRSVAKAVTLSVAYGAGAPQVAAAARVAPAEGAQLRASLLRAFPKAMSWCRRLRPQPAPDAGTGLLAGAPGARELRALGRRRLVLGAWNPQHGNAAVQGAAATMTKAALVGAAAEAVRLGGEAVMAVHDEIVLEVPEAEASAARSALVEAMAQAARAVLGEGALLPPVKAGSGRTLEEARGRR